MLCWRAGKGVSRSWALGHASNEISDSGAVRPPKVACALWHGSVRVVARVVARRLSATVERSCCLEGAARRKGAALVVPAAAA